MNVTRVCPKGLEGFQEILETVDGKRLSAQAHGSDAPEQVAILSIGAAPVTGTSRHIDALLVKNFGEDFYRWWWEVDPQSGEVVYHFTRSA